MFILHTYIRRTHVVLVHTVTLTVRSLSPKLGYYMYLFTSYNAPLAAALSMCFFEVTLFVGCISVHRFPLYGWCLQKGTLFDYFFSKRQRQRH
ncbi:uncharacterized protein EV420DRAFT_1585868 [Desarmillaria tabescens]|uniref:Uncharacterized protein n=1 Tax=Armillaria tabescens TaxID=1929756 RepID=A0AA39MKL7_ARMTA|nr:uncharacterized protein EV420DRAFT_1585868 [Desarmillaria tabescens]KAK0438331.1 hypothetical protein EV420DRAFT_1585868 [Desarmillaria tabescens]